MRETTPNARTLESPSGGGEHTEEARLVEGLISQDREAVAEFLNRAHHSVFRLACRLAPDFDLARDWCHEVLLGILDDMGKGKFVLHRPGGFWAWFRKRAYYRLLNEYARHRRYRRREASEPVLTGGSRRETVDRYAGTDPGPEERAVGTLDLPGGEDPAAALERAEARATVEACLERLKSAHQRQALWLFLLEDMTYPSIAERMAAPLNTVKAWIRRGRFALRRCVVQALGLVLPGG
jgi:RNA polymerase sigma-70 factor (ECF subfamily)